MREVTRTIMDVPGWLAVTFYVLVFAACGLATLVFLRRIGRYRQARRASRRSWSFGSLVRYLLFHEQIRRDRYAGLAHMLMFYGFSILFAGTCLVFLQHQTPLDFFYGRFYLAGSLIIDLGGVAFVVGLVMFLKRRLRGEERHSSVPVLIGLLLLIGITGFVLEGARIAIDAPAFEKWSVVGYALAVALRGMGISGDAAAWLQQVMWATHALFCIAFFALLPWGFFGHMAYGAASWATRSSSPRARLKTPRGDPGPTTWRDLGLHDLLQADACTTCGRCNDVCPAHAAGKPLRPREVVLGLRAALGDGDAPLTQFIPDDAIWSCTTCGACNEACPVGIEVYDKIVDVRRSRVETGEVPPIAEELFDSTADRFNPFDKPDGDRMNWAVGLQVPVAAYNEPVPLLYWIGCAGSFDPDGRNVSRAMVRILNHLGIEYRILGPAECCNGDPARRMGEEGLFQQQRAMVTERIDSHAVKHILTHCPHCFNTFRNEYDLPPEIQVEHHSQFLARMLDEGRLTLPAGPDEPVTFHDPCYLGRGNGETEAPRRVLRSLPQVRLAELRRSGRESFCCGAGGGSMWLDHPGAARVENLRAAEAAETGAATIATACPFCKSMLDAGCQSLDGATMKVKDLAELIVEAESL
jgi:Fe-S oxidoreductase/nitrate reductase gamma subunit